MTYYFIMSSYSFVFIFRLIALFITFLLLIVDLIGCSYRILWVTVSLTVVVANTIVSYSQHLVKIQAGSSKHKPYRLIKNITLKSESN